MSSDFAEGDELPKPMRALVEALREGIHSPNGIVIPQHSCEAVVKCADYYFRKPESPLEKEKARLQELLKEARELVCRLSKELGE